MNTHSAGHSNMLPPSSCGLSLSLSLLVVPRVTIVSLSLSNQLDQNRLGQATLMLARLSFWYHVLMQQTANLSFARVFIHHPEHFM